MDYEEKRELRKQISQLLADAGLNQAKLKEIVEEEIKNKVKRALEQKLTELNQNTPGGDYVLEQVNKEIRNGWGLKNSATEAFYRLLKGRRVTFNLEGEEGEVE